MGYRCMVNGCDWAGSVWFGGTVLCAVHAAQVEGEAG